MHGKETSSRAALLTALLTALLATLTGPATAQTDEARATISGTVIDATGKPIAGAAIDFVTTTGSFDIKSILASPQATSNAQGVFSVARPEDVKLRQMVVAAKGRQACAVFLEAEKPNARTDVGQVVLPRGTALVGRVRDTDGKPIQGVSILVTDAIANRAAYGVSRKLLSGSVTNARGIFQVPCVARTGLQVSLRKPGYQMQVRIASHESPLDITLATAQVVTGRLIDENGNPIANTVVTLEHEGHATSAYDFPTTQADGSFAINLPATAHRYRVSAFTYDPSRRFESALLRGPQKDIELHAVPWHTKHSEVVVQAIDKETGKPIPKFSVAPSYLRLDPLQLALFQADNHFQDYEGRARVSVESSSLKGLIVRAEGHAVAAVETPEQLDEPIVVELGPEAVIEGRVVDDSGKPVAGAAVRAFPYGRSSSSGGTISKHWPRTDKNGHYRIGCLQPGQHLVQVYPERSTASPPQKVVTTLAKATVLDLTIAAARRLSLQVTGALPPGPAPILTRPHYPGGGLGFQHSIPAPPPVTIRHGQNSHAFGFELGDRLNLSVALQSRTRVGTITSMKLPAIAVKNGKGVVALPQFAQTIMRGKIIADSHLPTERVAVMATPTNARDQRYDRLERQLLAGVSPEGSFTIDLPDGKYVLQLVDVETGIVFHTEAEDHEATAKNLVLRPRLHWLELQLRSSEQGAPAIADVFQVGLACPRDGTQSAFHRGYASRGLSRQGVRMHTHPRQLRWLVPAGSIQVGVSQAAQKLRCGGRGFTYAVVARESIEITGAENILQLTVPALPSDEELEKPWDK